MATSLLLPNYLSTMPLMNQVNSDLTSTRLEIFGGRSNRTPYMHQTLFSKEQDIVHKKFCVTVILSEKPLKL